VGADLAGFLIPASDAGSSFVTIIDQARSGRETLPGLFTKQPMMVGHGLA